VRQGDNPLFDFSPPASPSNTIANSNDDLIVTDFVTAARSAGYYKSAYYNRAANTANYFQAFEIPIIDTAVTAIAASAFKSSRDLSLGAGIAGGTFAILENFYAPRERALIYLAGHDAMSCIQRLASQGAAAYQDTNVSPAALDAIRSGAGSNPDPLKIAGFQKAIAVYVDGASELDDAITAANVNLTKQAISKAARPDTQQIASKLKQSASQASQNNNNNRGVTINDTPPQNLALVKQQLFKTTAIYADTSNTADDARLAAAQAAAAAAVIQAKVQQILDYSAEFEHNVTACKGVAG
jgi:hypothetical protein